MGAATRPRARVSWGAAAVTTSGPWRLTPTACQAVDRAFQAVGLAGGGDAAARARLVPSLSAPQALWHAPILRVAAGQRVGGITLGDWVYLDGEASLGRWALVAHEVAHVAQFRQRGVAPFLAGYAAGWVRGRVRGRDALRAYLELPDEVEARQVEAAAARMGAPERPWLVLAGAR